jgi:uncharacterized membrane protein
LNIKDYNFQSWHGTLLVIAIALIAMCFNTLLAKRLPLLEGILVILHLLGVVVVIPLWAMGSRSSGGGVLTEYFNGGGWSTVGLSTMVGMLPVALSLLGLDCSVHMGNMSPCVLKHSTLVLTS